MVLICESTFNIRFCNIRSGDGRVTLKRELAMLKGARDAYQPALTLNPKHLDALEYQCRLFLLLGQVDSLCFFGCYEYNDLKNAIVQQRVVS